MSKFIRHISALSPSLRAHRTFKYGSLALLGLALNCTRLNLLSSEAIQ